LVWQERHRETHYYGQAYARRYIDQMPHTFIDTLEHIIRNNPWWDTVDDIAANLVGKLVATHPTLVKKMDDWIESDHLWLRRTAILHQLKYKAETDEQRLFAFCLKCAAEEDFFIRKAIGWSLREYGKTAPQAVRKFVRANASDLSELSKKEALRRMGGK